MRGTVAGACTAKPGGLSEACQIKGGRVDGRVDVAKWVCVRKANFCAGTLLCSHCSFHRWSTWSLYPGCPSLSEHLSDAAGSANTGMGRFAEVPMTPLRLPTTHIAVP